MTHRFAYRSRLLVTAMIVGILACLPELPRASAQSDSTDWEKAAGGKMSFDVASVKRNTSGNNSVNRNFPWTTTTDVPQTGGLFIATNVTLYGYISFAYKPNLVQQTTLAGMLPKWAQTERFDIEGRANGNPTGDQYRLMVQSLLADRFKLAIRFETRDVPVFALVFAKPGKFGPHLRLHVDSPPCADSSTGIVPPGVLLTEPDGFPQVCGRVAPMKPEVPGPIAAYGGRNVLLADLCNRLGYLAISELGRPLIDGTGLTGKVDISIEWAPPVPPNSNIILAPQDEPGLAGALKEQLGLKLESMKTPLESIVIDHIEEPSPN